MTWKRTLHESIWIPEHEPREDDPNLAEYRKARHHAIDVLDTPCWVCGIKKSTGGKMETHHSIVEYSLQNAIDFTKIETDFPEFDIRDDEAFKKWLDSEGNLLVLCDLHHRGFGGIHSITYPPFHAQRYLKNDVQIVRNPNEAD